VHFLYCATLAQVVVWMIARGSEWNASSIPNRDCFMAVLFVCTLPVGLFHHCRYMLHEKAIDDDEHTNGKPRGNL
jgi:hypothetical protein